MAKATITFNEVIQDSLNYESFKENDDYMVAVIRFTIEIEDKQYKNMRVEIRQPFGTNFEQAPIEVGQIIGSYNGPWNHNQFAELCEQHYRSLIGSTGRHINLQGASQVRMRNISFVSERSVEMDIHEDGATSW